MTRASEPEAPPGLERSPRLRSDFGWTFAGNAIYAACQYAVLVVLAKRGSPELVGHYSLAVAVATPVITFAMLQLRSLQVSDVRRESPFGDYFTFRLITMLLALVSIAGLCAGLKYSGSTFALTEAVGLALAIEAISDIVYGQMQVNRRMDRIAKSMIGRGLLSLVVLVGAMIATGSLLWSILGMAAIRVAVFLCYDLGAARETAGESWRPSLRGMWRFRPDIQRNLLRLAFPVGLVSVLVSLNTSIPRYFIDWSLGPRELGLFSALAFFQSSGNMIVGALGQAAFGRMARHAADNDIAGFRRLLGKLLLVGGGLGIGGVAAAALLGRQVLTMLFRPEYAQRPRLLTYLMAAAAMGYLAQLIGYAVTAARIFKPQIPLFAVVASTLVVTSYLLTPRGGMGGAITAILITGLVQIMGLSFLLWAKLIRKQPERVTLRSTEVSLHAS